MQTKRLIEQVLSGRGVAGKFSVSEVDKGLKKIKTALKSIQTDKSYVKAGLMGKASRPHSPGAPLTSVQLGIIHEFGTGKIPARPFIRPSFEKNRAEYLKLLETLVAKKVYSGDMEYVRALGIIGSKMASDMKNYVTQGPEIPPPNEEKYFERKVEKGYWKTQKRNARAAKAGKPVQEGPNVPPRTLVDTGRMVNSITYGVVGRSTGDTQGK